MSELGRKRRPRVASQPTELLCSAEMHFRFRCYRTPIITVEQALAGAKPAIPLVDTGAAFKRTARENASSQPKLYI